MKNLEVSFFYYIFAVQKIKNIYYDGLYKIKEG